MTTTTDTRTVPADERAREVQWMLRRHDLYTLSGEHGMPQRMNSLGGARGILVQVEGDDARLTPYHPNPDELMAIYGATILALRAEGWHVTATLNVEGDRLMPALYAQPPAVDHWRR